MKKILILLGVVLGLLALSTPSTAQVLDDAPSLRSSTAMDSAAYRAALKQPGTFVLNDESDALLRAYFERHAHKALAVLGTELELQRSVMDWLQQPKRRRQVPGEVAMAYQRSYQRRLDWWREQPLSANRLDSIERLEGLKYALLPHGNQPLPDTAGLGQQTRSQIAWLTQRISLIEAFRAGQTHRLTVVNLIARSGAKNRYAYSVRFWRPGSAEPREAMWQEVPNGYLRLFVIPDDWITPEPFATDTAVAIDTAASQLSVESTSLGAVLATLTLQPGNTVLVRGHQISLQLFRQILTQAAPGVQVIVGGAGTVGAPVFLIAGSAVALGYRSLEEIRANLFEAYAYQASQLANGQLADLFQGPLPTLPPIEIEAPGGGAGAPGPDPGGPDDVATKLLAFVGAMWLVENLLDTTAVFTEASGGSGGVIRTLPDIVGAADPRVPSLWQNCAAAWSWRFITSDGLDLDVLQSADLESWRRMLDCFFGRAAVLVSVARDLPMPQATTDGEEEPAGNGGAVDRMRALVSGNLPDSDSALVAELQQLLDSFYIAVEITNAALEEVAMAGEEYREVLVARIMLERLFAELNMMALEFRMRHGKQRANHAELFTLMDHVTATYSEVREANQNCLDGLAQLLAFNPPELIDDLANEGATGGEVQEFQRWYQRLKRMLDTTIYGAAPEQIERSEAMINQLIVFFELYMAEVEDDLDIAHSVLDEDNERHMREYEELRRRLAIRFYRRMHVGFHWIQVILEDIRSDPDGLEDAEFGELRQQTTELARLLIGFYQTGFLFEEQELAGLFNELQRTLEEEVELTWNDWLSFDNRMPSCDEWLSPEQGLPRVHPSQLHPDSLDACIARAQAELISQISDLEIEADTSAALIELWLLGHQGLALLEMAEMKLELLIQIRNYFSATDNDRSVAHLEDIEFSTVRSFFQIRRGMLLSTVARRLTEFTEEPVSPEGARIFLEEGGDGL